MFSTAPLYKEKDTEVGSTGGHTRTRDTMMETMLEYYTKKNKFIRCNAEMFIRCNRTT